MNNNIAIIGKDDIIFGFKLLGIDTFPVESATEAESILDELINKDYNLVFITEEFAEEISQRIKELLEETRVSILIIPPPGPEKNIALNMMKKTIRRALGAEIHL